VKKYAVRYTDDAKADIFEITAFLLKQESIPRVRYTLKKLRQLSNSLITLPYRGHIPAELMEFGSCKFLEIHFKSYRMIYQVIKNQVFIHCVYDGRRNTQKLIEQRLLQKSHNITP